MHRLLVASPLLAADTPDLPNEAARHLKVLRVEDGETIELFDGHGQSRVYRYVAAMRALANPEPLRKIPPPERTLTLFACVTKGSRWDWTLEKATELGVTEIVPVISDRTIVRISKEDRAAKQARWQRIVEDAARQSDAVWLPTIAAPTDFRDVLPRVAAMTCFIGALTIPPSPPILRAVRDVPVARRRHVAAFIGPEGDLTPDELAALMRCAIPTSFGPTILRAETAAIFACSVLAAAQED